jgi:hypothetical protein
MEPAVPANSTIPKFNFPWETAKPASGIITADGMRGKMFSRAIKRRTPKYPIHEIRPITKLTIHIP